MLKVYVLVNAQAGAETSVAQKARAVEGVVAVEGVRGPYDLVVQAEVATPQQLHWDLLPRLRLIDGVLRVLPCQVGTAQPEVSALAG